MTRRRRAAGVEEKPKRLRRDAELRRREVGTEEKPKVHGVILSSDGARLECGCGDAGAARL
jgi:hypothetical protein